MDIGINDIYWIAGFLEGEGTFSKDRALVSASQKDKEPIEKLYSLLGGKIKEYYSDKKRDKYWYWYATGTRARGVIMTIFPLMTKRRKDAIKKTMDSSTSASQRKGDNCPRGKLKWAQVREIREQFNNGSSTKADLAKEYNVTHTNIRHILNHKSWKEGLWI